jgi:hypothetical protein
VFGRARRVIAQTVTRVTVPVFGQDPLAVATQDGITRAVIGSFGGRIVGGMPTCGEPCPVLGGFQAYRAAFLPYGTGMVLDPPSLYPSGGVPPNTAGGLTAVNRALMATAAY